PVTFSTRTRSSAGLWLGEVVATFGLLTVVLGIVRAGKVATVPFAVAGYVGAAYWFTSSTSFANPAVTVGRTLTDTFAGIGPASAPAFVLAQLVGGVLAVALATYLHPRGRLDPAVATAGVATSRGVPADVMAAGPATASVATGCAVPADPGAARPVLAEEPRCPNPPT
ncbi:MAG: aquaporin family protein, partial [Acidimicrobiia bacterium]